MLFGAHDPFAVERLLKASPRAGYVELDGDTTMNPHTAEAALRAAGACAQAVDGALTGEHRLAFCAVRPPGHHAERATPMGGYRVGLDPERRATMHTAAGA